MRGFRTRCRRLQEKVWRLGVVILMLAMPITACGSAPQAPEAVAAKETPLSAAGVDTNVTVTFQGEKCHYDGPERVPAGRFRLTLDVRDQVAYDGYAVVAVTLKEGKTHEDLLAWPSADPPPWTHGHGAVLVPRGELGWQEVWLDRGPLYMVCFTGDPGRKTDLLGPIEVEMTAPEARQQRKPLGVGDALESHLALSRTLIAPLTSGKTLTHFRSLHLRKAGARKRVLLQMLWEPSTRTATEASTESFSMPQHL
jgi:hypothetical protein